MVKIKDYTFEKNTPDALRKDATNRNWPVVYLLNNQDELYVGETISAMQRMKQHLENPERQRLDHLHIIYDEDFNKSATLDVESSLIALMGADKKYQLQNGCSGVVYHKYNNMHEFSQDSARFIEIWRQLQQRNMVTRNLKKFAIVICLNGLSLD